MASLKSTIWFYTKELGMDALALTDHGNIYGAVEFFKKSSKAGISR
jgi:DNA polymerase-3 subunit alpha